MGYYTNYCLDINKTYSGGCFSREKERTIVKRLCEITGYWSEWTEEQIDNLSDPSEIISYENIKWYDHDKDMLLLSTEFPECWFVLEGHGEEWDDIWSAMYHNGKMERVEAEIVYPDFREEEWWK